MPIHGSMRQMEIGTAGQIGCFAIALGLAVGAMTLYVCIRTGFREAVAVRFLVGAVGAVVLMAVAWRVLADRLG
jgi:hypothetical protein